jgi:protein-L-isoaspartate(D-aspartate) O-methyltransferase
MDTEEHTREKMVRDQIQRRGVNDPNVLAAMRTVPRHRFVEKDLRRMAYQDRPLPIGFDQTISQPYIVAYMTAQLQLKPDETVLEIGTGSGYQAAVLSRIVRQVYTIERIQALADIARDIMVQLNYDNVQVIYQDGSLGLKKFAPFDAILIGAASPALPLPLIDQLKVGGRIILPVGGSNHQILQRIKKLSDGSLETEDLIPVVFVPLRGFYGWHKDDWM